MNEKVIAFLIGGALGGTIGYLLGRRGIKNAVDAEVNKILKAEEEERAKRMDEELKAAKEEMSDLYDKALEGLKTYAAESGESSYPDPAEMMSPEEDAPEDDDDLDDIDRELAEEQDLIKRGGLVTHENENDIAGEELTAEMKKKPRLISSEEFDNGRPEFDKIQLMYFPDDDMLIEAESEEEVFDMNAVVGDCLDKYGFRSDDSEESVVFVRNFSFGCDYEIAKLHGHFYREDEE